MRFVSGPGRRVRQARGVLAGLAVLAALAGCVTTTTKSASGSGAGNGNGGALAKTSNNGKDIATASDQTNVDRLVKVRLDLASAYLARGQAKDALDEIKQLLTVSPDNGTAYGLRGLIYATLGDPATADESFRRALQLAPHDGDMMHNYAWFLCQQQRYPDAEAAFARTLAEPSYRGQARTLLAQGVCEARGGQLEVAEKTLSRAYELDPGSPTTAVNLAEVLYKRGDYDRARFYIRRVNTREELVSAQTLWLGAKIERKLGQDDLVQEMGTRLHARFPQAPETLQFEKGRFDE